VTSPRLSKRPNHVFYFTFETLTQFIGTPDILAVQYVSSGSRQKRVSFSSNTSRHKYYPFETHILTYTPLVMTYCRRARAG